MDHNTIVKVNDYRNLVVKLDATQKAFDGRLVGDFGVYGYSSKIHDISIHECCLLGSCTESYISSRN